MTLSPNAPLKTATTGKKSTGIFDPSKSQILQHSCPVLAGVLTVHTCLCPTAPPKQEAELVGRRFRKVH